jgi:hypothetical protein
MHRPPPGCWSTSAGSRAPDVHGYGLHGPPSWERKLALPRTEDNDPSQDGPFRTSRTCSMSPRWPTFGTSHCLAPLHFALTPGEHLHPVRRLSSERRCGRQVRARTLPRPNPFQPGRLACVARDGHAAERAGMGDPSGLGRASGTPGAGTFLIAALGMLATHFGSEKAARASCFPVQEQAVRLAEVGCFVLQEPSARRPPGRVRQCQFTK